MNWINLAFSVISSAMGIYAYGYVIFAVLSGKMQTSFWGRLIWLGSNSVVLLALFGGEASLMTIVPMAINVSLMVVIQISCAIKRLFAITRVDIICLVIVAFGLVFYLFANESIGLVITLVADGIGGTLVILNMFRGARENRRQFVLSGARNVLMLFANDNPATFLSVCGLTFQTIEAVALTICAHITKSRRTKEIEK